MINFGKGGKDEFAKLSPEAGFGDRADIIRRHLAEVFGSKNLSFLIGSGCPPYMHEGNEPGIWGLDDLKVAWHGLIKSEHPALYGCLAAVGDIHGPVNDGMPYLHGGWNYGDEAAVKANGQHLHSLRSDRLALSLKFQWIKSLEGLAKNRDGFLAVLSTSGFSVWRFCI
ncbi:MAG: hypothetical protein OXC72_09965 [Roseovarius sp.]|nr:hypothetical protein [Roseovarius sp.]MCY4292064.1 hypothetical protein [Roseovarius sp.]